VQPAFQHKIRSTKDTRKSLPEFPVPPFSRRECDLARRHEIPKREMKKRRGHPATGQPLLSRENSSNGALKSVKTFCANLMSPKTGVSSDFYEINVFVFNGLQNQSIPPMSVPI
jgi:hypothetical protein